MDTAGKGGHYEKTGKDSQRKRKNLVYQRTGTRLFLLGDYGNADSLGLPQVLRKLISFDKEMISLWFGQIFRDEVPAMFVFYDRRERYFALGYCIIG